MIFFFFKLNFGRIWKMGLHQPSAKVVYCCMHTPHVSRASFPQQIVVSPSWDDFQGKCKSGPDLGVSLDG